VALATEQLTRNEQVSGSSSLVGSSGIGLPKVNFICSAPHRLSTTHVTVQKSMNGNPKSHGSTRFAKIIP